VEARLAYRLPPPCAGERGSDVEGGVIVSIFLALGGRAVADAFDAFTPVDVEGIFPTVGILVGFIFILG